MFTFLSGPEITFNANRPFLTLIQHDKTGNIIFAGQVNDPS